MRRLYSCFSALLILLVAHTAGASHFYGADFFYEHISDSTYRISLVVYGDCKGSAFPSLDGSTVTVEISAGGISQQEIKLSQSGLGVEVTPVCPAQAGNTNCISPSYPIPGVKRYVYTKTWVAPFRSTNWVFLFAGTMTGAAAGRSLSITNLLTGGPSSNGTVTLEALLNNKTPAGGLDSNSSPVFTTIPTPFYCINIAQQYNQGAVDADKDSLVYNLVPALAGVGSNTVSYKPGFSATAPLATAPGSFSFSTRTGQMSFTPNAIQRSLVVNQVSEYRNGVLIGTASREMTFIVLDNCNNSPAYSIMDTGAASGGVPNVSTFHACEGTDSIHFNIVPLLPGMDTILATVHGMPAGATATITKNKTPKPVITIDWKTLSIPAGRYNFFVTYNDNDCPLSSTQTQAYTIQIVRKPVAAFAGPDVLCPGDTGTFRFTGTIGAGADINYVWDWDYPAYTSGDTAGPWRVSWDREGVKTIRMRVVEDGCSSDEVKKQVRLKPRPYAGFDALRDVCRFDTLRLSYNTRPDEGLEYAWHFDGADTPFAEGPGPYLLHWDTAGIKHVSLTVTLDGCTDTRSVDINVRPLPPVRILNAPGPVCLGDKIFLQATGGDKYIWSPADSLLFSPDGNMYAQILRPSVYRVLVVSEYGCIDSAAINYDIVEPCCNFAYPNAFSPNGDGRNDRFRIVTYGNHLRYELSIYNNWGQRVYYGLDADEGWDGKFNSKPCDAGTYFYYLNATCFTGRQESRKGDLMLVK